MENDGRLRVLLVDDNPGLSKVTGVNQGLAPYVELQWLRSEESAKRFLDFCMQLDRVAPNELIDFAPELIIIDYNLKKPLEGFLEFRADLDELEARVTKFGMRMSSPARPSRKSERSGAVLGILIATCFRTYPCLAYPASGVQKGQDAADALLEELEWSLDEGQYKNFDQRGSEIDFNKIILKAMPALRKRLFDLAKSQLISVSLYELAVLISDIKMFQDLGLNFRFRSRFGTRCIAIQALFLDFPSTEDRSSDAQLQAASEWATSLWNAILTASGESTAQVIRDAIDHTEKIWAAFCDEGSVRSRHELSDLSRRRMAEDLRKRNSGSGALTEAEMKILGKLEKEEPLTYAETKRLKELEKEFDVRNGKCRKFAVVTDHDNGHVIKWSALLLAVRYAEFVSVTSQKFRALLATMGRRMKGTDSTLQRYLDIDQFTSLELNLVWFPVPSAPIILDKDQFSAGYLGRDLSRNHKITGDAVREGKCVSNGERAVLQIYARGLGFTDWPQWLKGDLGDEQK